MLALFQERLWKLMSIPLVAALAFLGVMAGDPSLPGHAGSQGKEVATKRESKAILVASKSASRTIARKDSRLDTTNFIHSAGQKFLSRTAPEQILVHHSGIRRLADADLACLSVRGPPVAAL